MNVSLAAFLDFLLNAGPTRIDMVRRLKHQPPPDDFYKPLRDAMVDALRTDHERQPTVVPTLSALDNLMDGLDALPPREQRVFPKVIDGYWKLMRQVVPRGSKPPWFEPGLRDWPVGHEVAVRVNPEIGLTIEGTPHMIQLYMRGDPISPQRIALTTTILAGALCPTWPGFMMAVLDVRRGRLYPAREPKPELVHLIHAEAACFASLWKAL